MIEDDTLDVMDTQRTLNRMGILYKMEVCKNGEVALAYLQSLTEGVRPDIILLDLNMPKMNGVEFLSVFRNSDRWKDSKVFVITTSEEKEDRQKMQHFFLPR